MQLFCCFSIIICIDEDRRDEVIFAQTVVLYLHHEIKTKNTQISTR